VHLDEEASQRHSQGLACQKEQELKEELLKCQVDLKKVTIVKEQLERNVAEIMRTFKRLFEEA
jgi:hypothetical protein